MSAISLPPVKGIMGSMIPGSLIALILGLGNLGASGADTIPAPQRFLQEVAHGYTERSGLPHGPVQLMDCQLSGTIRTFIGGNWYSLYENKWEVQQNLKPASDEEFAFADSQGQKVRVQLPWQEVRQVVFVAPAFYIALSSKIFRVDKGELKLVWPDGDHVNQMALDPNGVLHIASANGLFKEKPEGWQRIEAQDQSGRDWAARNVLGLGFDKEGRLWLATKAGVGCRNEKEWRFYEGKDGLPWNDFTGVTAGASGEMWFSTHLGAIRFDGTAWSYLQGRCWLPNDDVSAVALDAQGSAWFATAGGVGRLERRPMTLSQKADLYEEEIERYIKRTPFGFVAEARLRKAADKASADPQDSDNDGLWTAMYGAGECFAYGATRDHRAKDRARKAFEALRFLQKVTRNCEHAPPGGFIARSIRPSEWPDPNIGHPESDLRAQKQDKLWKVYEPRWPRSADGKWFWKSDTSSDELDGHFFFYPLYFDFCADSPAERERVREVVRDVTDHLMAHEFALVDHDGRPTRWAVYGPKALNYDPNRWEERGLNSLSILCYLTIAAHITGDRKYEKAARELIERHSYALNIMYPKVQQGPGSGNQSDDEMAFMCYYGLLRYSSDENLKPLVRYSFFRYWANEAPEMNPFFNFAYAAHSLDTTVASPWGTLSLKPWPDWLQDSMATLYGLPLDRLNWSHLNSHRLDVVSLPRVRSSDLTEPDYQRERGHLVNGKVLPVQNRHFNHWNTDPWQLDYGGNGEELAAGTVFLLPYYMGLYHGFIAKPGN